VQAGEYRGLKVDARIRGSALGSHTRKERKGIRRPLSLGISVLLADLEESGISAKLTAVTVEGLKPPRIVAITCGNPQKVEQMVVIIANIARESLSKECL
jgi:hypothetical protein